MKTSSIMVLGLAMAGDVTAFVSHPAQTKTTSHLYAENGAVEQSRRGFVQNMGLAGVAAAFAASSIPALAEEGGVEAIIGDATAGEATATVMGTIQSSSLRSVKRAEKQLSKLELFAADNDYEDLKLGLRNAPFSDVRKNCSTVIKEFSGNPDLQSKLTASYTEFIKAVENLDNTAGLGMRGRKLDSGALLQCFQATSASLNGFIAVATAEAS